MKFARWVFAIAGVYGVITVAPLYFMEQAIGKQDPPPITHPDVLLRIRRGNAGMAVALLCDCPATSADCAPSFPSPYSRSCPLVSARWLSIGRADSTTATSTSAASTFCWQRSSFSAGSSYRAKRQKS